MSVEPELSVLVVIPTFQEAENIDNVLTQVREAYMELERRHTHGKIVLKP